MGTGFEVGLKKIQRDKEGKQGCNLALENHGYEKGN